MPAVPDIVCPVFIGRRDELAVLGETLAAAATGAGRAVVVTGEAGIGKSRLVAELATLATDASWRVLPGRCFESERELAFAPFRELIHEHIAGGLPDDVKRDLEAFLPDLYAIDEIGAKPEPNAGQRLGYALTRLFAGLASAGPLLLVMEDAHWIDDASLGCVVSIARRLDRLPMVVLLTCRREEASTALLHALDELHRARGLTKVHLRPLTLVETSGVAQAILGPDRVPRPAIVHDLHELTGGNAFFVEEVMAVLGASGEIEQPVGPLDRRRLAELALPATVQESVRMRVGSLGDPARTLVMTASVLGQRFDYEILAEMMGIDDPPLVAALRGAVDANLIVEEAPDRFRFRHALIHQAIEAGLLRQERRVLHRRALDVISARSPGNVDALARHAFEAEEWRDALAHAMEAGAQALALGAPHAALAHYDRALEAATGLDTEPPIAAVRGRGQAFDVIGDFEAARVDYERTIDMATDAHEDRAAWQAHLDLGLLWCSRDYAEAARHYEQALTLARSSGTAAMIAASLNRLGNWLVNVERPDAGLAHHQEALALFRELGDRRGEADTLDLAAMACALGGDAFAAVDYSRQALTLFRELGDRSGEARSFGVDMPSGTREVLAGTGTGTLDGLIAHLRRSARLSSEIGWLAGESFALSMLAEALATRGEFGEALAAGDDALAIATSIGHSQWAIQALAALGTTRLEMGDAATADARLREGLRIAERVASSMWVLLLRANLCEAAVLRGDLHEADEALQPLLDTHPPMRTMAQRTLWYAAAMLRLAQGRRREALEIVNALYASVRSPGEEGDIPALALLKARAMDGDRHAAINLLGAALEHAGGQRAGPMELRIRTALATLLAAGGQSADVAREVAAARALIDRLAATVPDGDDRTAYIAWAIEQLPGSRRGPGGLTPREVEVAGLVAHGMSNREIAERLSISERTAEAHVGAGMRKLGFRSRSQLAAWAVEHGLRHRGIQE